MHCVGGRQGAVRAAAGQGPPPVGAARGPEGLQALNASWQPPATQLLAGGCQLQDAPVLCLVDAVVARTVAVWSPVAEGSGATANAAVPQRLLVVR